MFKHVAGKIVQNYTTVGSSVGKYIDKKTPPPGNINSSFVLFKNNLITF